MSKSRTLETSMQHSLEELGEFVDSNIDGYFAIWQCAKQNATSKGRWGCATSNKTARETHYGATPGDAVKAALNAHDSNQNPDNQ